MGVGLEWEGNEIKKGVCCEGRGFFMEIFKKDLCIRGGMEKMLWICIKVWGWIVKGFVGVCCMWGRVWS